MPLFLPAQQKVQQIVQQTALTLRTIRFVKKSQLAHRLWFKVRKISPPGTNPAPELRARTGWVAPIPKASVVSAEDHYTFLNKSVDFSSGIAWSNAPASRLWLYNLHYFDFINSPDSQDRSAASVAVMRDWVSANPPVQGTGWEPYPASLRIVNWIKWLIAAEEYPVDLLDSLAVQIRWLSRTVEYHILANHLFTNGKALVYAGVFFSGAEADRWLAQGLNIVNAELKEQVLEDGGHFERSPMYHHIILEDLLDLINRAQVTPGTVDEEVLSGWQATAVAMLGWAKSMSHPSGDIAFFNDAAHGIAPGLQKLVDYTGRLGINFNSVSFEDNQSRLLAPSGYALLRSSSTRLIADVAPVGPDYQPGHAHADTLSFELAHKGETLIVNSGTSTYEMGEQRQHERSTRAHSTVEVNGKDSSEVWAGFRVARRARPFDIHFETDAHSTSVAASHNGYHRLVSPVTHTRKWVLNEEKLEITDWLTGEFSSAVARFYLHPDVQVVDDQYLQTKLGSRIGWDVQGGVVEIKKSFWYPAFGKSEENRHISVAVTNSPLRFTLYFL